MRPGESITLPNWVVVSNYSPDPDGPEGDQGNVEVSVSGEHGALVEYVAGSFFNIYVGGDGSWSSPRGIGKLTFTTTGGMGVAPIDGALELRAGGGIGDIECGELWAEAASIGDVTTDGDLSIGVTYGIGNVECGGNAKRLVGMQGNNVNIQGSLHWLNGYYEDIVVESDFLGSTGFSVTNLTVRGNAASFTVFNTPESILIEGSLLNARFNSNISDDFTVQGSVGRVEYEQSTGQWIPAQWWTYGIQVYGAIPSSSTVTVGGINRLEVTGNIEGTIVSTDDIFYMSATGGILGATVTAATDIGTVTSPQSLSATITSESGEIGGVIATGGISGTISAYEEIGNIQAGGNITADVTSTSGAILIVHTPVSINSSLSAFGHVSQVLAGGEIAGSISSSAGNVGSVIAQAGVSGSVSAAGTIFTVRSENGSVNASVTAGGTITRIWAKQSVGTSESGDLIAISGGSVLEVTATNGSIKADISAAVDLGDITALHGLIKGTITAGRNIGDVWAGGNIESDITTTTGNLDSVLAGVNGGGDITGDISVGRTIGVVDAKGTVSGGNLNALLELVMDFPWQGYKDALMSGTELPELELPTAPTVTSGKIEGKITAGRNIGSVIADGAISGDIQATGAIGKVESQSDISGKIDSQDGGLKVTAYGAISGDVNAAETIFVSAYGVISGTVKSQNGGAQVSSLDSITGDVEAEDAIRQWAAKNISGSFLSHGNSVEIVALDSFTGCGSSAACSIVVGLKAVTPAGPVSAVLDLVVTTSGLTFGISGQVGRDAYIYTFGDSSANLQAREIYVTTWGNFTGSAVATGNIYIDSLGDVSLSGNGAQSSGGNINVQGKNVSGDFITTGNGKSVQIQAWGQFTGKVQSAHNAKVSAFEGIDAEITAAARLMVSSHGSISGTLQGGTVYDTAEENQHRVTTWGSLSAPVTTGSSTQVFVYGDLTSKVTLSAAPSSAAPQDLTLTVIGSVTGQEITTSGDATISVGRNFEGTVLAGDDVNFTVFGEIQGDITAGNDALTGGTPEADAAEHVAFVYANGEISGNVTAPHGVRVEAFGTINGEITASHGAVEIIARAGLDEEGAGTYSHFSGKVTAALHVGITAAGNIVSSSQIQGLAIDLKAGKEINAMLLVATDGPLNASAGAGFIGTTITTGGDEGTLSISAGATVQVTTFTASQSASISAKDNVQLQTGTTQAGNISVTTLANLNQSTLTAAADVSLTAYESISQVTAVAQSGKLQAVSGGTMTSSPLTGYLDVAVTALGSISGTGPILSTAGSVTLYSGGSLSASTNVKAYASASVVAKDDVLAKVEATTGSAGVESHLGQISGDVTGLTGVTVTTLTGNISGKIQTTTGTARVSSAGTISEQISAIAGAVVVDAMGSISSPTISGLGDVTVSTFSTITGQTIVSNEGDVTISAVGDVSPEITAALDATVSSAQGSILKSVSAGLGSAEVTAGVDVKKEVSAGLDATVTALGEISQVISAGRDAFVAANGGSVLQTVSAGRDVEVFALDEVQQTVTAGRDTTVTAFGSIMQNVTAGRNATLTAAGAIQGDVLAGENATLFTTDLLAGNVTATTGSIQVEAWGYVTTLLTAGTNASIFAGDGGSISADSGAATSITAIGILQALVNAGTTADVLATSALTGSVEAGTDATVLSFTDATIWVSAGGHALVFAGSSYQGPVDGGLTAAVISLGSMSGVQISASDIAIAYAVGSITTASIQADSVAMISWDMIGGPAIIQGESSAYVYAHTSFDGQITASTGSAALITLGSTSPLSSVSAATDAFALTAGSFRGSLSAGGFGGIIALQDFSGTLTTGSDALVLTEGVLSGSVSAGQDAFAWSLTDVTGSISAERDAAIVAFGSFSGALAAGRDVLGVGTVGDLEGTITAARNVGDLLCYAAFSASVSATNSVNELDQGRIGNVTALGSISGSLTAAYSIGDVESADAITASLSAPTIGSVIPNSTTLLSTLITPEIPVSVRADVLADGETAKDAVLADVDDFHASADQFEDDIDEQRADLLDDLAAARTDVTADNAATAVEIQDEIDIARQTAEDDLATDLAAAATNRQDIADEVYEKRQQQQNVWTTAVAANELAFATSVTEAHTAQAEAAGVREQALADKIAVVFIVISTRGARTQQWYAHAPSVTGILTGILNSINPVTAVPAFIEHVSSEFRQVTTLHGNLVQAADELGAQGWARVYLVYGGIAADFTGVRNLMGSIYGEDPYTLEQWTNGYALFKGVTGIIQLVETAFGISGAISRFSTPCGSWNWGVCFTAGHEIVVEEGSSEIVAAMPAVPPESSAWSSILIVVVSAAVGYSGYRFVRRCDQQQIQRRVKQRRKRQRVLESAFTRWEAWESSVSESRTVVPSDAPAPHDSQAASGTCIIHPLPRPAELAQRLEHQPDPVGSVIWKSCGALWLIAWLLVGGFFSLQALQDTAQPAIAATSPPTVRKIASKTRRIEDIRAGDLVLAHNPETGEQTRQRVARTFHRISDHLRHVRLEDPQGTSQQIETTDEHPFWVPETNTWIAAADLRIGQNVQTTTGQRLTVSDSRRETHPTGIDVYNFEVEDFHTYFVAAPGTPATHAVLVHNTCADNLGEYSVGQYHTLRNQIKGLDAHHVGQKALMKELVPGYDPSTGPAILVNSIGHTIKNLDNGIVSRSMNGINNARSLVARDILELRRVYPDIPNTQLQALIYLNKEMYPVMRRGE